MDKKNPRKRMTETSISGEIVQVNANIPSLKDSDRALPKLLARIDVDLRILKETSNSVEYKSIINQFDKDLVILRVNYKNTYCGRYIINMIPKLEYYTVRHRTLNVKSPLKTYKKNNSQKIDIPPERKDTVSHFNSNNIYSYNESQGKIYKINKTMNEIMNPIILRNDNRPREEVIREKIKELAKEAKNKQLISIEKTNLRIELGKLLQELTDNEEYFTKDGTRPIRFEQIERSLAYLVETDIENIGNNTDSSKDEDKSNNKQTSEKKKTKTIWKHSLS